MRNQRLAISLMFAQAILFAIETAMVHHIGPSVSVMQLSLLRSLAGVGVVVAIARNQTVFQTDQLPLQLLRGLVAVSYSWVMMYSFARLPYADATAISCTQAIYIVVFSAALLDERITLLRCAAVGVGVVGAALIVKPTFLEYNVYYLVALLGTSLNGLAFVMNKYAQRRGEPPLTTMFYANAVPVLCNLPLLPMTGFPALELWPWLSGVLLFGPIGMYLGIKAVKYDQASTLGPYTLLRLVMGIGVGILVFREMPDLLASVGVAAILMSCFLSVAQRFPETPRTVSR